MNTERRGWNPRSAAVSAEDQPQRPRIPAGTRWNQRRPTGPTCCGWCSAHTAALREKSSQRDDFAVALAISRPPENCRRRLALRPGGTPQEISRGQARASGRSPRLPRRTGHAPAGHRRNIWRRTLRSRSSTTRPLGQVRPPAIGRYPGPFLRCPAGARSHSARFPGAASAGADLPPANLLRRPSGTGTGRPRTDKGKPPAQEWRLNLVRLRLRLSAFIVSLWSIQSVGLAFRFPPLPSHMNTETTKWLLPVPYPCPSVSIRGFNLPSPSAPHRSAA